MAVREYCDGLKCNNGSWIVVGVVLLFWVTTTIEEVEAVRVIERREKWLQKNLVIQTLPRGYVSPPSRNPCSNTPGGRGRCTLAAARNKEVVMSSFSSSSSSSTFAAAATTPHHHAPEPPLSPAAAFNFPGTTTVRFAAVAAAASTKEISDHLNQESSS